MNEAERTVAELAADQFGVVSRAQALENGMASRTIHRRTTSGTWEALLPGVYRLGGTTRTGRQLAMAATLWAGDQSVISHVTAGRLLRLERIAADGIHLTVPRGSGLRSDRIHLHRALALEPRDRTVVDGIPCTSATRTILDCAAMLDEETLEIAFEHARRMRLTSPTALTRRAEQLCRSGRPGSTAIKRLLAHQLDGERPMESPLEVLAARLLRTSRIPQPTRQFWVGRFRIDFAWAPQLFGVECEGFEVHGGRLRWKQDKRRTATLESKGWRLMFVTWDDVTRHPDETVERIALALKER